MANRSLPGVPYQEPKNSDETVFLDENNLLKRSSLANILTLGGGSGGGGLTWLVLNEVDFPYTVSGSIGLICYSTSDNQKIEIEETLPQLTEVKIINLGATLQVGGNVTIKVLNGSILNLIKGVNNWIYWQDPISATDLNVEITSGLEPSIVNMTNAAFWFSGREPATITETNGKVSNWASSTVAIDAINADETTRPITVTSSEGFFGVQFEGSLGERRLNVPNFTDNTWDTAYTVFLVLKYNSFLGTSTVNNCAFGLPSNTEGNASNGFAVLCYEGNLTDRRFGGNTVWGAAVNPDIANMTTDQIYVFCLRYAGDGTRAELWLDGNKQTINGGSDNPLDDTDFGAVLGYHGWATKSRLDGIIFEAGMSLDPLSDSEIDQINSDLIAAYLT